jgi:hypothetical protein
MENPLFKVGDRVRVVRIPAHIEDPNYPYAEVHHAFSVAQGNVYRVDSVDWGGWVWLDLGEEEGGGIGIQPDCVELVERAERN